MEAVREAGRASSSCRARSWPARPRPSGLPPVPEVSRLRRKGRAAADFSTVSVPNHTEHLTGSRASWRRHPRASSPLRGPASPGGSRRATACPRVTAHTPATKPPVPSVCCSIMHQPSRTARLGTARRGARRPHATRPRTSRRGRAGPAWPHRRPSTSSLPGSPRQRSRSSRRRRRSTTRSAQPTTRTSFPGRTASSGGSYGGGSTPVDTEPRSPRRSATTGQLDLHRQSRLPGTGSLTAERPSFAWLFTLPYPPIPSSQPALPADGPGRRTSAGAFPPRGAWTSRRASPTR